jgi:hypothetical protein
MRFKIFYESQSRRHYSKSYIAHQEHLKETLGEAVVEDTVEGKEQVIELMNSDGWEMPSPSEFKNSLSKSKHALMLSDYSEAEFSKMKLFKMPGQDIGFALKDHDGKPFCEVVAVFNNSPFRGIGDAMMQSVIRLGGRYLDHFDGFLTDLYSRNGFVEYKRVPYDPQYDPTGVFKKQYGPVDVIYRVYKGS